MFALLSVISGYPLKPTNLQCGVSACCLCKPAAEEQPEWLWQRGNASPLYRWVTLATVAISHNSGRRNTRHQLWLWHVWQPFDISDTEEQPPSCFYLLLSFFWGSVRIYDGELKWSGRKNYWCLSKYDSSSTQMSVWVLKILWLFVRWHVSTFIFIFFFHFLLSNVLPYKKTACLI